MVKTREDELVDELLESVDLSTYGLERTKLNHAIGLDDSESELDPQKSQSPRPAWWGERTKTPSMRSSKAFNERWFHGWDATPEDQRVKNSLP